MRLVNDVLDLSRLEAQMMKYDLEMKHFIFPAEYETDDAFLFLVLLVFIRVNQCAKYHLCQAGGICADGL